MGPVKPNHAKPNTHCNAVVSESRTGAAAVAAASSQSRWKVAIFTAIAATPRSANVIHHGVATSQADSQRPKARGRPARMNSATPQNSATTDHAPATSTISCIGTSVSICDMRRESERRDLRRLLARADDDLVRGEQQAEARGVVATAPAQRLAQESIGQHLV